MFTPLLALFWQEYFDLSWYKLFWRTLDILHPYPKNRLPWPHAFRTQTFWKKLQQKPYAYLSAFGACFSKLHTLFNGQPKYPSTLLTKSGFHANGGRHVVVFYAHHDIIVYGQFGRFLDGGAHGFANWECRRSGETDENQVRSIGRRQYGGILSGEDLFCNNFRYNNLMYDYCKNLWQVKCDLKGLLDLSYWHEFEPSNGLQDAVPTSVGCFEAVRRLNKTPSEKETFRTYFRPHNGFWSHQISMAFHSEEQGFTNTKNTDENN